MRIVLLGAIVALAGSCAVAPGGRASVQEGGNEGAAGAGQPVPRHEHAYVEVGGKFYTLGGRGDRPVQVFDPVSERWSDRAPPPLEIHHFQGVEYDGKIYVVGALTGGFPDETPVPNVYVYDPARDSWEMGPEIPADRRRGSAAAVLYRDRIYVLGGLQHGHRGGNVGWLDVFDPASGSWTPLADAPHGRDHFQAAVIDGKLYAAAGRQSSIERRGPDQLPVVETDVYDLTTGRWTTLPASANVPTPRSGTAAVAFDGRLIVIGGESGSQQAAHDEVEAFDPRTGTWVSLKPLRQGRHATQAIVHDGRIYIAAGSRTRGATEISSQEVYSPEM